MATPEQWANVAEWANLGSSRDACVLELRERVEKLELGAGIHDAVAKELRRSSLVEPGGSLVEKVRNVIASEYDPADFCWDEARAAIREVAAWLREHAGGTRAAWMLDMEAEP